MARQQINLVSAFRPKEAHGVVCHIQGFCSAGAVWFLLCPLLIPVSSTAVHLNGSFSCILYYGHLSKKEIHPMASKSGPCPTLAFLSQVCEKWISLPRARARGTKGDIQWRYCQTVTKFISHVSGATMSRRLER